MNHSDELFREHGWNYFFLVFAVFFGAIVRLGPSISAGFPINDGGMFYTIIRDLIANNFTYQNILSYNNLYTPIIYPPLGFYLAGFLATIPGADLLWIIQFLPPVLSLLIIPAYYSLASTLLSSKELGALATLLYVLLPRSSSWLIMGGGLTRALGTLFLIFAIKYGYQVFVDNDRKKIFPATLFSALTLYSHPESSVHAIAIFAAMVFIFGRSSKGWTHATVIASGTAVLVLPFYAAQISEIGVEPVRSATATGGHSIGFLVIWMTGIMAEEPFLSIISVLGLVGIVLQLSERKSFLLVILLLPALVQPRSQGTIATIPLAMLAAIGLHFLVKSLLKTVRDFQDSRVRVKVTMLVIGYVILYGFFSAAYSAFFLSGSNYLGQAEREAFKWVTANTPANSTFIVLTGSKRPYEDATNEWFPALSGRESLTTIQGKEWVLGWEYNRTLNQLSAGQQSCSHPTADCVRAFENMLGNPEYDFLFVSTENDGDAPGDEIYFQSFQEASGDFQLVYSTETVRIYARNQGQPP